MICRARTAAVIFLSLFCAAADLSQGAAAYAQDFGFGFADEAENASAALPVQVKVGGEVKAELTGFVHDFQSREKVETSSLGDIFSGTLKFTASGANVDAFIGLDVSAAAFRDLADSSQLADSSRLAAPSILDEAYIRVYMGRLSLQAGLRKLTWGKADSMGPLDVINPPDYRDLTNITDIMAVKIARPLVHAAWNMGDFSKLEAVFIPNFLGSQFASSGRWVPAQYSNTLSLVETNIFTRISDEFGDAIPVPILETIFQNVRANFREGDFFSMPDTGGLEYLQTGLRFTTTVGSGDIGAQYFYGNIFRPGFTLSGLDAFLENIITNIMNGNPLAISPDIINYNRYHQFGLDWAQVLFGFNTRAEFAFHLTEDYTGSDGGITNPFIAWSFGFDRDLFWGINANVQLNETIRLLDSEVGENPALDFEAGTDISSTRLIAQLAKKFLRDNLENTVTVIWDIESGGCYIIPAIAWTIRDFRAELSAGIFAGKEKSELGQYWKNSFIRTGLTYSF